MHVSRTLGSFALPFVVVVMTAGQASATAVTLRDARAVDASCKRVAQLPARAPLEVTYSSYGQSCAPGGPCSTTPHTDLPIDQLVVTVAQCTANLPGRFVRTGRRCNGATVYRWKGALPSDSTLRLVGRSGAGSVRTAKALSPAASYTCPAARPLGAPLVLSRRSLDRTFSPGPRDFELLTRPDGTRALRVIPRKVININGGWGFETLTTQVKARTLEQAMAKLPSSPIARVKTDAQVIMQTYRANTRTYCERKQLTQSRVTLEGSSVVFLGSSESLIRRYEGTCKPPKKR